MSKTSGSRFIIVLITSIPILFGVTTGRADNIAPEVQTQINKRTDLFQKSVHDLPSIEKSLEDKKQATINAMGDGKTSAPQGLSSITKKSKGELENESGKLESIHENDLNSCGREEMMKKNVINELYPDYSKPLNKQYMKDAKDLSEGQNKLMANLFAKLKEVGVDCKTIKGEKKHEPEYFLKIRTTHHKDTIYNETFCEEPRNKYNCRDSLLLRCTKKGMAWNPWQNRTMVKTFGEIPRHWWIVGHYADSGYHGGWKMSCGKWTINSAYSQEMATYIAGMIGARPEQVNVGDQNIVLIAAPNRGSINVDFSNCHLTWLGYIDIVPVRVTFHYQYRDGYEICEQWSEDWNEGCGLQ